MVDKDKFNEFFLVAGSCRGGSCKGRLKNWKSGISYTIKLCPTEKSDSQQNHRYCLIGTSSAVCFGVVGTVILTLKELYRRGG